MDSRLERVLEPEWMDTAEEADAYDRMDHAEVNGLFIADFAKGGGARGLVLDVGCGPAHIPIVLAEAEPAARIVAVDAARHMLRHGREHVRRKNLLSRVRLVCCDAKRLPFGDGVFDAVMSNSIVHHVPDPVPAFAEMRRVLRPGGALFVRDLHRPRDQAMLDELVARHARDADATQRALFRDSLHAALTVNEVDAALHAAGFENDVTVRMTSDRHWTASARRR